MSRPVIGFLEAIKRRAASAMQDYDDGADLKAIVKLADAALDAERLIGELEAAVAVDAPRSSMQHDNPCSICGELKPSTLRLPVTFICKKCRDKRHVDLCPNCGGR